MAIYFVRLSDFKVEKVIASHDQIMTSISANPQSPFRLASAYADGNILVWDIEKEKPDLKVSIPNGIPLAIEFCPFDNEGLLIVVDNGDIRNLDLTSGKTEKIGSISTATMIRWNLHSVGVFALGCDDGRVVIMTMKKTKTTKFIAKKIAVEDIQWDPNSPNYLLAAWKDGTMSLFDSETEKEMQSFERQGAGITCIAWIKTVPGGFVTCNEKIAAIRIWNVSNKSPIGTIKIGNTGLLNIMNLNQTSLGRESLFCAFRDGSVGVFNYHKKKLEYLSPANHSETIFEVVFKPSDKNILASGSFDGSVKIWNIDGMECIQTLSKPISKNTSVHNRNIARFREFAIYGIAWHPKKENKLVAVDAYGSVTLWDVTKNKVLQDITPGSTNAIFRVDWNTNSPFQIATGSSDGLCFIFNYQGETISLARKIKHPGVVNGVAFNPFRGEQLATACQDGNVRVFDISSTSDTPIKMLQGHTNKVFNIVWNPLVPNILASGSDDCMVRVWDTEQGTSIPLAGHKDKVRALVWNYELPYILFSGSWDTTIRMWDIREKNYIHTATEHHADIYGLACHPERPFMYASCSRDTSIRFWTIEHILSAPLLRVLVNNDWNSVLGSPAEIYKTKGSVKLCGRISSALANDIQKSPQGSSIDIYEKITGLFIYLDYQSEFWDLVRVLLENKVENIKNRVVFYKNLPELYLSKAKELESGNKGGFSYDSSNKKTDKVMEAAKLYLKLGEYEHYCESLVKIGQWEKAMAFAPSVSMDYWQNLAKRYSTYLAEKDDQDVYECQIISGQADEAVKHFMNRGDFEDAKLIASLKQMGKYDDLINTKEEKTLEPAKRSKDSLVDESLREIIDNLAETYLQQGHPILAACTHLSINDPSSAVIKLIRANETVLAYTLTKLFKLNLQNYVSWIVAKRAERNGEFELGVSLLKSLEQPALLSLYCASSAKSEKALVDIYQKNNLGTFDKYAQDGAKYEASGDIINAVYSYVVAKRADKAANLAVNYARVCIKEQRLMELPNLFEIFEILQNAEIFGLDQKLKEEAIAFSLYFGLKKAMWKGLYPVISSFRRILAELITRGVDFPISAHTIELECLSYTAQNKPEATYKKLTNLQNLLTDSNQKNACNMIMKNLTNHVIKESKNKHIEGELNKHKVYIAGNDLPSHVNRESVLRSIFTQQPITSEGYAMEDQKSVVTLEEALMWGMCTMVSPLCSGQIINPY